MTWAIPTPEEQVQFLRNIQRLLAEGLFVASYKFALLHALADLAVLRGDDTGGPLDLDTKDIAAKFIELYWQQCRPFQMGGENTGLILQQNTGKQAAIISQIVESQQECGASLFRLKQVATQRWTELVSEVDQVVRVMPLWKLQTVGDERLDFLYHNLDRGTKITLRPGVAYCLRAFYELLRDMLQTFSSTLICIFVPFHVRGIVVGAPAKLPSAGRLCKRLQHEDRLASANGCVIGSRAGHLQDGTDVNADAIGHSRRSDSLDPNPRLWPPFHDHVRLIDDLNHGQRPWYSSACV
jgi:hypothetical protein